MAQRGQTGTVFSATFTARLWRWESRRDEWRFVTVPSEPSEEIDAMPRPPRGFDSVRVRVTVGATVWSTSVFPNGAGTYSLPIKRAVRDAEGIEDDGDVRVTVEVI